MSTLKDLKNRIDSVKSTKKVTAAMKSVAASKLRKAEERVEDARPYAESMERVLANVAEGAKHSPTAPKLLTGTGSEDTHLLVVMTSNRGLCGGFNANIVRKAKQATERLREAGKRVKIITVGKKGRDILRRTHSDLFVEHFEMPAREGVAFEEAQEIADEVLRRFREGGLDVATVFYGVFETAMTQIPTGRQIIPAKIPEGHAGGAGGAGHEHEPSEEAILRELMPRNVAVQIFRALLENVASEHGARMTAMDNATKNAEEMVEDLERQYNRQRQAAITTELTEIIAGAEAI